jgi:hypothetical protein
MKPSKQVLVLLRFYDFGIGLETVQMTNGGAKGTRKSTRR